VSGPLLRVEGVTRVFGSGRTLVRAVDGVDLATDEGEVTLVMGPSGSGKTTLLSLIGGILRPTSGRIVIAGADITALSRRELARVRRERVGFVFQTFNLLDALSARENVEIALNVAGVRGPNAAGRARALLVEAGLGDRLDFHARDLSGGERQRVAIARALANEPRLLLADEPTANLDSDHGREVMELLRELTKRKGNAAVVVSHDERLRSVADRVLWLEDGRLRAERKPRVARRGGARGVVSPGDPTRSLDRGSISRT
jgi:putative ABC transport system ATP-binding protein